ncbi:hypothetical protein CPLU01_02152 [Colletotrichum plurivorum]|uniref:Uncharacterized protein n=1 Tax=Colletotrichum plurivorum TaxID=2175906 RepID=A0A8H6KWC3_9PEZI|nr:hypothetical protein CPLU01_02152 [Colletotrichum plurivorum]
MARKTGSSSKAAANDNHDIRSFFKGRAPAKKGQPVLTSSQTSGGLPAQAPSSPASTSGADGSSRDVKQRRHRVRPSKKRSLARDENSAPITEEHAGSSGSDVSPARPPIASASFSNSTSLSELRSSPSLPSSVARELVSSPRRSKKSGSKRHGERFTDTNMSPSGRATGSARKVRFRSAPSTPGQASEPDEEKTPVRLLFSGQKKPASQGTPGSPANALPFLPSVKRSSGLSTPERSQTEQIAADTPSSLPSLPDLPSSPSIPPSPSTARKRSAYSRDAVIKGSDDEDGDSFSDCSLPDLDMLAPVRPRTDPCGTPKAKRRARMVHKSPLTIQPKHKFDFKTLDAHSRRHDVRFDTPKKEEEAQVKDAVMTDLEASPSKSRQKLIELAGVQTEEDADKALKAMERTKDPSSKTRWYFFKKHLDDWPSPIWFPKKSAKGPWAFLEKSRTRDRHVVSGMPTSMAASLALPDELFFWVLNMASVEKVGVLREEYSRLAAANKNQVRRLVTPQILAAVFHQQGAVDEIGNETLQPVREVREIYAERDWKPLISFLDWLYNVARCLEHDAVTYAVKMLLRMAADRVVLEHPDVLVGHQLALTALVNNVPDGVWNEFCTEVCSSVYHGFEKSSLRILPLMCMPVTSAKLHEMRRRLAIAFFLRDAALANRHPEEAMALRLIVARVKDSDFRLNPKTDYADLKAQVQLLDLAIDDGSFVPDPDDREHEKTFNAEIDDLAKRLKAIWRGINDTGAANLARTEAKSVLEWVGQRLTYSVRTRPPPTQSIFGDQGPSSEKKRRQQDFMKKFVHGRKNKQVQSDVREVLGISSDDDDDDDETFVTALG